MRKSRRSFLGLLGAGFVAAPALPGILEELVAEPEVGAELSVGAGEATAVVQSGRIIAVSVISGGSGYAAEPEMTLIGGGEPW
jgi:hypothetical protein